MILLTRQRLHDAGEASLVCASWSVHFRFFFCPTRLYSAGSIMLTRDTKRFCVPIGIALFAVAATLRGWDYDGHRLINQLALTALPADYPAFVRQAAARERIAFLSGEPDRWRNTPEELSFSHATAPDHYFDLEYLEATSLRPETLPIFRYDFAVKLAAAHAVHPDQFPPIDPNRNRDHTQELIGFLPWTLAENVGRLKSAFSYLKASEQHGGTTEEIANAEANIIYTMGVMGHFVGDATQPLHTTKHHHGWVGANPNGYTTNRGFHAWIDGGYFLKTGGADFDKLSGQIRPAQVLPEAANAEALFRSMTDYLTESHALVEPLYRLEKEGKLSGEGDLGQAGKPFLERRLLKAGQMLADLWLSAWEQAPEDSYLIRKLTERQVAKLEKIRALVVTGGHDFELSPFLVLFQSFADVTFRHVSHTNADAMLSPGGAKDYDVIVLYDLWQMIDETAKANFVKLATGGKGFVVLHHAIANYDEWDEYAELLGARYYLRSKTIGGVLKARSQYQHDVKFTVKIADPRHPVTRGLRDFVIHDETYKGFDVAEGVKPLLTTDEPLSGPVIGWTKLNGKSRWVYIQLGHDHFAYENANYRQLVHRAIRWASEVE